MEDKFIVGLMLGMVGGAVIVANSVKARTLVKQGQQEIIDKAKDLKNKKTKQSKQGEVDNAEPNE